MRPEVTFATPLLTRRHMLSGLACATSLAALLAGAGASRAQNAPAKVHLMSPQEAHRAAQAGEILLVDIRRPEEWAATRVGEGAIPLDMQAQDFVNALVTLRQTNPAKPIALICATGARSAYVTKALAKQGFPGLVDVSEGMMGNGRGPGWLRSDLPTYAGTPSNVAAHRKAALP